jgi:single-strand DNA-binding protein
LPAGRSDVVAEPVARRLFFLLAAPYHTAPIREGSRSHWRGTLRALHSRAMRVWFLFAILKNRSRRRQRAPQKRSTSMSNGTLNRVELLGHLGAEPEMRYTSGGVAVTNFRVATNTVYKVGDEERTETEWTPIAVWRGLAEVCNRHLHKGSRVYVEGRLKTRSWEDEAGTTHYRTEVQADQVIFLDGRPALAASSAEEELPEDLGPADAEKAELPRKRRTA